MNIEDQIISYIESQSEIKKADMFTLHKLIMDTLPNCKLWFLDGKNEENKIVSNPNIGYGNYTIKYADGKTKQFYQVGISANCCRSKKNYLNFTCKLESKVETKRFIVREILQTDTEKTYFTHHC